MDRWINIDRWIDIERWINIERWIDIERWIYLSISLTVHKEIHKTAKKQIHPLNTRL